MQDMVAVCPGSFDPVTVGHLDIIQRAAAIYGKVVVVVGRNDQKQPTFSVQERMEMVRKTTCGLPNVEVASDDGLLADFCEKIGAKVIIKGLRAMSDFEYEFQMALTNRKLNPMLETVFICTSAENMYLSSSMVKQVGSHGGDIRDFVPPEIHDFVKDRLHK